MADKLDATNKSKNMEKPEKGGKHGRKPKPEKTRTKLKKGEFHVAAVLDHWPQEWTQRHATHYLLRWEEGIDDDWWSKESDVSNDLLDEYWESKGIENRNVALAKRASEAKKSKE
jgi:hypothetical protein